MKLWLFKTLAAGLVTGLLAIASLHPAVPLAKSVMAYTDHLHDIFAFVDQAERR
jgi:hypothetical protein